MNNGEGPPEKEKVGVLGGTPAKLQHSQTTQPADHGQVQGASETFEDLAHAFELLQIRPPEYVEYEENDYGGSRNWRLRPVSEAQRRVLGKFGIKSPREDCSFNQGTAAQILNRLIGRIHKGKCRYADAIWLHRRGVKNAANLSWDEARQLIKAIKEKGA
jgi:hypothetical protein